LLVEKVSSDPAPEGLPASGRERRFGSALVHEIRRLLIHSNLTTGQAAIVAHAEFSSNFFVTGLQIWYDSDSALARPAGGASSSPPHSLDVRRIAYGKHEGKPGSSSWGGEGGRHESMSDQRSLSRFRLKSFRRSCNTCSLSHVMRTKGVWPARCGFAHAARFDIGNIANL